MLVLRRNEPNDADQICEVSKEHARKEGEGDLSLAYWRQVHKDFFSDELKVEQKDFSETMDVVCEEFKLIYVA